MSLAQQAFQEAVMHHRAGRLAEAESQYRHALTIDAAHADSRALLGLLAHQTGRLELAIGSLSAAIALRPDAAGYHCSLGNALGAQGDAAAALECYDHALEIDPQHLETLNNRGSLLQAQGRLAEAAGCLGMAVLLRPDLAELHFNLANVQAALGQPEAAIRGYREALLRRPGYAEVHNNLGLALAQQGEAAAAVEWYEAALAVRPDYADALTNLGNTLRILGRLEAAEACHRRAIACQPNHADACNNLGNVLKDLGRLGEAADCFRRALDISPALATGYYNLGTVLQDQWQLDEAVISLRRAVALRPDYAEAWNNLGIALHHQGRLDEALVATRRALQLQPRLAEAHNTLGMVQRELGALAGATASFRAAIAAAPQLAEAHHNLALVLLATGALDEGWRAHEWRWQTRQMASARRQFSQPQWRGEPAAGLTLLVHAEQGFGDTLQFCRYAALAAARGLRVVMEVQPPLVRLLQSLDGAAQVVAAGEPHPAFDLHCPMLSLPLALGTTLTSIPAADAYLQPDAAAVAGWRRRLDRVAGAGLRVGLVWAGNPRIQSPELAALDRRRSLAPERLLPLSGIAGAQFVSLQKFGAEAPADMPMLRLMHEMADFADTAALVAGLDLVISVDTAVAHLAGAVGTPVWLLDRFDPCWRWLTGRRDSPWYPKLRIYRQPRAGDWDSVIGEIAHDLARLAARHERRTEGATREPAAA